MKFETKIIFAMGAAVFSTVVSAQMKIETFT